jgi:hypothetical protein
MSASLPSGLARRLTRSQFVMTAEVVPPVSCGLVVPMATGRST